MNEFVHEVKNFITDEETELIRNSVFKMKDDWKPIIDYKRFSELKQFATNKEKVLHVLGDAIYLLVEGDYSEINLDLRTELKREFDWLYLKLFNTIKNVFGVDQVQFANNLTVPGFHVFGEHKVENAEYGFHQDSSILHYCPLVNPVKIGSFALLIQSPPTKPYLEIDSENGFEKLYYDYKSLYFWYGIIPHRIGKFSLKENEYRITFQGHFYVDPDTDIVKVYF